MSVDCGVMIIAFRDKNECDIVIREATIYSF